MILLTGCAGFIGSHVTERLLKEKRSVVGVDNFDDYYSSDLKEGNLAIARTYDQFCLEKGDIRDIEFLRRIFDRHEIDLVVHLAARAGVRPSILQPLLYEDVNVGGTMNILEVMRQKAVRRIIFASSSSVYGNNPKIPFAESDNVDRPISPYAATKKAGELLCYTYHHLFEFEAYCLRFFTVYGPRQRPEMAIAHFTRNVLEGKKIKLYSMGRSSRDYTYIDDIVDGVMSGIRNLNGYEIINLGGSHPIELGALVKIIESKTGRPAHCEFLPPQEGDVDTTYADISKAKRMLGYDPKHSIDEGIASYVKWLGSL